MSCCAIVDLRQYTVHPGRRDDLVDVFDRYFVDGQEAVGMHIVGEFRDLDDPERFVWMRGFPDMPTRAAASQAFYTGPEWREHGPKANETMVDSTNVVMLRPLRVHPAFPTRETPRPAMDGSHLTVVSATVWHRRSLDDGFAELFSQQIEPVLDDTGGTPLASFETLDEENNFPGLRQRTDPVFVRLARFDDDESYAAHQRTLTASPLWQEKFLPEIERLSAKAPQRLRLRPTGYSHLH